MTIFTCTISVQAKKALWLRTLQGRQTLSLKETILSGRTGGPETLISTCTTFRAKKKYLFVLTHAPQKTPAISDGRIVWADGRIKGTNIFIYDIATGKEKTVSTASEYESNPAIDGNRIVWQDKRKGTMDIFMFTEDASETGIAAEEEKGDEAGSGAKESPLGIYPASAAVIAAYLIVTSGKDRKRKI